MSRRLGASRSGESARQRLLCEDVQRGAREVARAQGLDERSLVDERAARGVDEQRTGTQQRQALASRSGRASRA